MMILRKRNCRLEVCFTKDELSDLTKKARKARLSNGGFVRCAVCEALFTEAPPADYYTLIREVKRVGSNIDQLLKLANSKGLLDVPAIRKALDQNRAVEQMLWDTFRPKHS